MILSYPIGNMTENSEVFGEYLNKSDKSKLNNTKRNNSKRKKWINYATIERHVQKIDIRSLEKDLHIKDISVPAHLPTR